MRRDGDETLQESTEASAKLLIHFTGLDSSNGVASECGMKNAFEENDTA